MEISKLHCVTGCKRCSFTTSSLMSAPRASNRQAANAEGLEELGNNFLTGAKKILTPV